MESRERFRRLESLYRRDPANARLARDCIDAALEAGEFSFVLEQAGGVLATAPNDLQALFDRASALIGLREYREAARALETVRAAAPQVVAVNINLGLCHYCLGEFPQARQALDAAYAAGDRSAGLLRLLVSTYHHLSLVDEALALCQANPEPVDADGALAGTYALVALDAEEPELAGRWATRALAANPSSIDGLVVEGTLNVARGEIESAARQFERSIELAPGAARAWIGLGAIALLENDLPRARAQLARGVDLMPTHVGSLHVLAWAHLMAKDLDAAESVLNRALELDRNFGETHGGLASIAALRGQRAEAERLIKVALRLDEKCLSAQFARSVLLGLAGNPREAQHLIRRTAAGLASENSSVLGRVIDRVTRH